MPDEGAAQCTACPAGSSTDATGSTKADDCRCLEGRYMASVNGANTCQVCPEGMSSDSGATSINQCFCQAGTKTYLDPLSQTCQPCTAMDIELAQQRAPPCPILHPVSPSHDAEVCTVLSPTRPGRRRLR